MKALSVTVIASALLLTGCSSNDPEPVASPNSTASSTAPTTTENQTAAPSETASATEEQELVVETVYDTITFLSTWDEVAKFEADGAKITEEANLAGLKELASPLIKNFNVDPDEEKSIIAVFAEYTSGYLPLGTLAEEGDTFDVTIPVEAVTVDGDTAKVDAKAITVIANGKETAPGETSFPREAGDPYETINLTKVDGKWLIEVNPETMKYVEEMMNM